MQTVVCLKWGTAFGPEYVNRLHRGVMRNVTRPTRFVALTDDASGLAQGIDSAPIPPIRLADGMRRGPWRKLALWGPRVADISGDVLFLDLDVVVTGSLDAFFDFEPGKLCIIRNWTQMKQETGNSSVMRFPVGAASHLVSEFETDPVALSFKYVNEQNYLCRESRLPMAFWPAPWCASFKNTMMPPWPLRLVRAPALPPDTRIVVFTGTPRPEQAMRGEWPAPWYKKIYKTIPPVTWLKDHWN